MSETARVYRARWVISNRAGTIEDAAVVCADGRIARVGPWSRLQPHVGARDAVEDLGESAILPGFVNGHTHLSLSDMKGRLRPTRNFAAWIGRLTARRLARTKNAIRRAVRQGAEESLAAGTAAGADVTTEPAFDDALAGGPIRWRVFGEVLRFGEAGRRFTEERIADLEALRAQTGLEVGIAPHAPYTLGIEDFMRARREADARGWPVSAHLHETLDEIEFTRSGQGDLHKWLSLARFLPKDLAPLGKRPIPALAEAGFFKGPVLVAHGNYLTDEEMAILAQSRSSVAFCPRSHAFFGHADHPWRRLLAAGANVCLGTDSLASSPSLSVLDEMRYLAAEHAEAEPRLLLEMATGRGARALGFADDLGDLAEGLRADFCVVGPVAQPLDPLAAILGGEGSVRKVLVAGEDLQGANRREIVG
ncbi:MAG TPA: amidohydrolase family protein [Phycisphaerae bacterium]|nr:amidohydrolase family protein [Phycisphaerae bacterium]